MPTGVISGPAPSAPSDVVATLRTHLPLLRCVYCHSSLSLEQLHHGDPDLGPDGTLTCNGCSVRYPIISGTPRLVREPFRTQLRRWYGEDRTRVLDDEQATPARDQASATKVDTAESFAFEWEQFGKMRPEWEKNFRDYLAPLDPVDLDGRLVVDIGAGSGRHSYFAAQAGARVIAVDAGQSIDVARRNLPPSALTVQADADHLPLKPGEADFVMSIGVVHHLPDPHAALRSMAQVLKPAGTAQFYVYWEGERPSHRLALRGVRLLRQVTTHMPHRALAALCVPLAGVLFAFVVIPYRSLRRRPRGRRVAARLPLKTYADYPIGVCVNDQFDRFSAPIERRYSAEGARALVDGTGLMVTSVRPNAGWVVTCRKPESPLRDASRQ